jgi:glycosyltransferase involved in cell wall biosynthesis
MSPTVSIIIPCHNAGRWLRETLESALAQTQPDCEILVVDDGSTDDSVAIARTFESRGVRVLTQANAGASAARNAGLAVARGAYVQFLDADDLLSPDKLAHQVPLLQAHADCIVSCAWGRFTVDPAAVVLDPQRGLWRDLAPVDWLVLAAEKNLMMATATWLLPRAIVDRIGPWDSRHRANPIDDMDYFDRARAASRRVLFCPQACTYYRSGIAGSLSRIRTDAAWQAISDTLHGAADRLLRLEDSPRTRHAAATLLQRFIYESYPARPDLGATAAARVSQLGGTELQPEFGPARRRLARLIGWKMTQRLHRLL